jgi:precorrin-6B methylase 2
MSYVVVSSHRGMALDAGRNDAYARALAAAITPDSVVLDLGAGTGVHGLMAARLGARRVYLVEPEDIIALAEENVRANGLQDVVRCIQGRIEDVTLPEPVDVIVSALTGNFLLTEDLLPVLFHARDRFLRPGGHLIPGAATMEVMPVTAEALHEREIASWSRPQQGVDLAAARPYAANTLFYRTEGFEALTELADPVLVNSIDFYKSLYEPLNSTVESIVTRPGICHGWLGWFSAKLGDTWFSTSPRAPRSHWSLAFLPLDPPLALEQGEPVGFQLARAPYGDWLWTTRAKAGAQRHSTLAASPMKASTLRKAALDYRPDLSDEGRAVAHVLALCDGARTMSEIAQSLQAFQPDRYRTPAEALRLVQTVAKQHA